MYWGVETILDAENCDLQSISSIPNIQSFIDELCEKTKMKKMGNLHYERVPKDDYSVLKDIDGLSVCQFILTSSIVIHFCETSKSMYLNFFSCKEYDDKIIPELVKKYFSSTSMKHLVVPRDYKLPHYPHNHTYIS